MVHGKNHRKGFEVEGGVETVIAGIDVGLKRCHIAVIKKDKVIYLGELRLDFPIKFAGIDAPLTLPQEGFFRECERELHKIGIRIIPPIFLKRIHEIGAKIADELRRKDAEVFEVYPYATRWILGMRWSKRRKEGRSKILEALRSYIEFPPTDDHNEIDAIVSALTVKMFLEGKGEIICGRDGCILIPHRSLLSQSS